MPDYYDRDGNPLDLMEWARLYENEANVRVALDDINGATVSTVWLGLNHNHGDGPPLIFETMIFGGEHDQYCERYATLGAAETGHLVACRLVRGEYQS